MAEGASAVTVLPTVGVVPLYMCATFFSSASTICFSWKRVKKALVRGYKKKKVHRH